MRTRGTRDRSIYLFIFFLSLSSMNCNLSLLKHGEPEKDNNTNIIATRLSIISLRAVFPTRNVSISEDCWILYGGIIYKSSGRGKRSSRILFYALIKILLHQGDKISPRYFAFFPPIFPTEQKNPIDQSR